jgi:molecular chaperone IbpA
MEDVAMRTYDLSPLFRSTVGFDRMMRLLDTTGREDGSLSYPPYNIEKTGENTYRIVMAVAGFAEDDLTVGVEDGLLSVAGRGLKEEDQSRYLHRGIARRAFERRFELADHIQVVGANLANGLLSIELVREVPEAKKPRTIKVVAGESSPKVIEDKAA